VGGDFSFATRVASKARRVRALASTSAFSRKGAAINQSIHNVQEYLEQKSLSEGPRQL
jgi:hypothetical protein